MSNIINFNDESLAGILKHIRVSTTHIFKKTEEMSKGLKLLSDKFNNEIRLLWDEIEKLKDNNAN